MQIKKSDLQEALEIVKPGLANKEIIEQSTSFAFINGRVITYNDEISISHPIVGLEIEGAIQAEKLYSLLSKTKKEEIDITITDTEIILSSGRSKAGLTLQSEIKLPLKEDIIEQGDWFELPENFNKFLKFSAPSASRDMSRPKLTAVHVNQSGFIEACDNYRITRCELQSEIPVKSFLIPATSVMDVVRIQPTQISAGKGWMHFKTEEDTIISCRVMEEEYPDTSAFLKVTGQSLKFPQSIGEVLDKSSAFAKRQHSLDETVTITIENKSLKLRAEGEGGSGWYEDTLNMNYSGEFIEFHITPFLLKGIISETLAFVLGKDKLKFEGEGWVYISALRTKK